MKTAERVDTARGSEHPRTGTLALVAANLAGLAAFCWPLLYAPAASGEAGAHAADAPFLLLVLTPLLIVVAVEEARDRHGDARLVALLGALVAVNAMLRIPKGPSGEGFVFILPPLVGWALGARMGFLLGAFTMLASAFLTGGVGPWLPFQMFALGWVGAGGGLLRRATRGRARTPALTAYAVGSSLVYGFAMTLWFWPFLGSDGPTFFSPGLGVAETLARYVRFYVVTSLGWDVGRALLATAPLVALLARPVCELLERTGRRFTSTVQAVEAGPM